MQISYAIHTLPLGEPFQISKGTFHQRRHLVVGLHLDGHTGYGEATEISYYGIALERLTARIDAQLAALSSIKLDHPLNYYAQIQPLFADAPFLLCALDCAAHDLYGKLHGRTTRENLHIEQRDPLPVSSYTIGIGPPEEMQRKIREKPWPAYKIKLGTANDLEILHSIRQVTDATVRVDANEGWTRSNCLSMFQAMADGQVEFVEQPLHRDHDTYLGEIRSQLPLPAIADESCQGPADVIRCADAFHGINIKLMKCGGLTPAMQMIAEARDLGLQVMIGCMTESSIGISAAAQLIPLVDYVDLDGAMLIAEDPATGVSFDQGSVIYPDLPGSGCTLKDAVSPTVK